MKKLAVILTLVAIIVVAAYAYTDFTIGARERLYAGNGVTDVSFIALNNDSVRVQAPLLINDKITAGGTKFAKIDSFLTTAALDTVVMSGASVGDVILVSQLTPTWSATPDTNITYHAYVLNTDSVVVARTKNAAANDFKSAGIYTVILVNK